MPWFKVDDGFANSKPVLRIPRRYRTQAVGLWVLAGTWAAKELTDGHIPEYVLEDFASTPTIAGHLVAAGLWETADDGYQFVGWSKYQPTKEQVLTSRAEEAERRKLGRESRRKASEQGKDESVREMSGRTNHGHPPDKPRTPLVPTRPDPTRPSSLVTKGGGVTLSNAPEPPPCSKHPENSDKPCRACKLRRQWDEAQAERQVADELHARRLAKERSENCPDCHGTNTVDVGDNAARICHHPAVSHA